MAEEDEEEAQEPPKPVNKVVRDSAAPLSGVALPGVGGTSNKV